MNKKCCLSNVEDLVSVLAHGDESELDSIAGVPEQVEMDSLAQLSISILQRTDFSFDDDVVKEHLDEILVLLIGVRNGANGKQLIEDVSSVFGTVLSPGTVYPYLHRLTDDGVLAMREHIRTKEYRIADAEEAYGRIRGRIEQEVVLAFLLSVFDDRVLSEADADAESE